MLTAALYVPVFCGFCRFLPQPYDEQNPEQISSTSKRLNLLSVDPGVLTEPSRRQNLWVPQRQHFIPQKKQLITPGYVAFW